VVGGRRVRPLAELAVEEGDIRWVVPEVQLLYKSKGTRPRDEADFEAVLPTLSDEQRRWLDQALETQPHIPGARLRADSGAIRKATGRQ
jgi:hypothetical protein